MNDETRKQTALQRYKIISPVLMETGRNRNEYFRQMAEKEHVFAGSKPRKVAVSTMKLWLKAYREKGFDGLLPGKRADGGRPRRIGEKEMAAIAGKCRAFPHWSVQKLYEELLDHVE